MGDGGVIGRQGDRTMVSNTGVEMGLLIAIRKGVAPTWTMRDWAKRPPTLARLKAVAEYTPTPAPAPAPAHPPNGGLLQPHQSITLYYTAVTIRYQH